MENYLGEETFRQGVHNYLAAHLYANATAEDFWGAQTATSHKPVDKIMESLVAQPGEPLLTFGEPARRQGCSRARSASSSAPASSPTPRRSGRCRFASRPADGPGVPAATPAEATLNVPAGGLFFANAGGKGYYRSAYPPSVYAALVAQRGNRTDARPSASA